MVYFRLEDELGRSEPLGEEEAEEALRTALLDSVRHHLVAYVPVGSVARGKELVTTGGTMVVGNQTVQGKTTACAGCHGPDLMGTPDVPPIAGRSPSYLARQLYDFQQGTRNGASAPLMRLVVANLTEEDIVAITAYAASLRTP